MPSNEPSKFQIAMVIVAGICILGGALPLPYILYIGWRFGWLDERISLAPFGMIPTGVGLAILWISNLLEAKR